MCNDIKPGRAKVIKSTQRFINPKNGRFYARLWISPTKNKIVEIDKCLVPMVEELNNKGIVTTFSCCGHDGVADEDGSTYSPYIVIWYKTKNDRRRAMYTIKKYWSDCFCDTDQGIWRNSQGYRQLRIKGLKRMI